MIARIVQFLAEILVRIIGDEPCAVAIARMHYGKDGRFQIWNAKQQDDSNDELDTMGFSGSGG